MLLILVRAPSGAYHKPNLFQILHQNININLFVSPWYPLTLGILTQSHFIPCVTPLGCVSTDHFDLTSSS